VGDHMLFLVNMAYAEFVLENLHIREKFQDAEKQAGN
jgi:hypothetical protein